MAQVIHLTDEMSAQLATEEVSGCLHHKSSPRLAVLEKSHILGKGVAGGDGVETVDVLHILSLQGVCLFLIVIGSIERKDVYKETDDTGAFFLLDESG